LSIFFCPAILTPIRKLVPPIPNTVPTFSYYYFLKSASIFSIYIGTFTAYFIQYVYGHAIQYIPRSSIKILTCYSFIFFPRRTSILKANVWSSLDVCICYVWQQVVINKTRWSHHWEVKIVLQCSPLLTEFSPDSSIT
jgi:hypothetical protein